MTLQSGTFRSSGAWFEPEYPFHKVQFTYGAFWNDIDTDGDLDLLVLHSDSATLYENTLLGFSLREHSLNEDIAAGRLSRWPDTAAWADADSDGLDDMWLLRKGAADGSVPGLIALYLNHRGFDFHLQSDSEFALDGFLPDTLVVGDFDGDGDPDALSFGRKSPATAPCGVSLFARNSGDGSVAITIQDLQASTTGSIGYFQCPFTLRYDSPLETYFLGRWMHLSAGDLDSDGILDITGVNQLNIGHMRQDPFDGYMDETEAHMAHVWKGTGGGRFEHITATDSLSTARKPPCDQATCLHNIKHSDQYVMSTSLADVDDDGEK